MSRAYTKVVNGTLVLKKPLTLRALKSRARAGRINVNVEFSLDELLGTDINGLNDIADERVLDLDKIIESLDRRPPDPHRFQMPHPLSDISYTVVGHNPYNNGRDTLCGSVIIQINADVSDIIGD